MSVLNPIVLVDDDMDDEEMIREALADIGVKNKVINFPNGEDAFLYLESTTDQPLIILCDVNMPKMNGLELKRKIDEDPKLRERAIPFVFLSTSVDKMAVIESYTNFSLQGFFKKASSYDELKKLLALIIEYWKTCHHPNSYKVLD